MAKIRVYELAKQLSVSSKEVMDVLKEIGFEVRSHQSGIEDSVAHKATVILIKRSVKTDSTNKSQDEVKSMSLKASAETADLTKDSSPSSSGKISSNSSTPSLDNISSSSVSPSERQESSSDSILTEQRLEKDKTSAVPETFGRVAPKKQQKNDSLPPAPSSSVSVKKTADEPVSKPDFSQRQQQGGQYQDRGQDKGARQSQNFQKRDGFSSPNYQRQQQGGQYQDRGQDRVQDKGARQSQNFQKRDGFSSPNYQRQQQGGQYQDRGQDRVQDKGARQSQNFQKRDGFSSPNYQRQQQGGQYQDRGQDRVQDKGARQSQNFQKRDGFSSSNYQRQFASKLSAADIPMPYLQKPVQNSQRQQKQHYIEKKEQQITAKGRMLIQTHKSAAVQKKARLEKKAEAPVIEQAIEVAFPITIGEFASLMSIKSSDIIKKLLENGRLLAINHSLDKDLIYFIMDLFEIPHDKISFREDILSDEDDVDDPRFMLPRPPVVTILGHVDHGKTSLLDAIRKTNVTAGEAGGITQKIGAYVVEHDSKKIVFVDTPGHEAFTAMRARGAQVTDIAILVVAVDDGVKPQTIEAINHAKAAKVPIIVALNKIDKPGVNLDRVKQQLADHGLVPEDWGGDVICVPVSAKARIGLDDLLEMILLVAEMQELKANPKRHAYGIILESRLDRGLGCVATVLVQKGTLKPGDSVIAGLTSGRVRLLINENGERIKKATPSIPVEIVGLMDLPNAGDILRAVKDDKLARQISDERQMRDRERHLVSGPRTTLQDLFRTMSEGERKELDVLIKADSNGSVEAIKHSLAKLPDDEVKVNVVHGAVGAVSESDVHLARASSSLIIGFNIKLEPNIKKLAEQEKVTIRLYDVIYHMIEDIKAAMKGMLEPEYESVLIGKAEVRQIFKASKVGVIAGSYVLSGSISRNSDVKVYRGKKLIHEGKLESLKRFKDDVKEVAEGFECGISIESFNDIEVGDIIEAYQMKEKVR